MLDGRKFPTNLEEATQPKLLFSILDRKNLLDHIKEFNPISTKYQIREIINGGGTILIHRVLCTKSKAAIRVGEYAFIRFFGIGTKGSKFTNAVLGKAKDIPKDWNSTLIELIGISFFQQTADTIGQAETYNKEDMLKRGESSMAMHTRRAIIKIYCYHYCSKLLKLSVS